MGMADGLSGESPWSFMFNWSAELAPAKALACICISCTAPSTAAQYRREGQGVETEGNWSSLLFHTE